jgi:hypothetical protein
MLGELLDVALIAYHPDRLPNARYQRKLDATARELASRVSGTAQSPRELRKIHLLVARGNPRALTVTPE